MVRVHHQLGGGGRSHPRPSRATLRPQFQTVRRAWVGDGEAIGLLQVAGDAGEGYGVSPALIDGAMHLCRGVSPACHQDKKCTPRKAPSGGLLANLSCDSFSRFCFVGKAKKIERTSPMRPDVRRAISKKFLPGGTIFLCKFYMISTTLQLKMETKNKRNCIRLQKHTSQRILMVFNTDRAYFGVKFCSQNLQELLPISPWPPWRNFF